jgi:hypothetical protein
MNLTNIGYSVGNCAWRRVTIDYYIELTVRDGYGFD